MYRGHLHSTPGFPSSPLKFMFFLFAIFIACSGVSAQQPLNLDFEKRSVQESRPWGWESTGWGASVFSVDSVTVQQGKYSLKAYCENDCAAESYRFLIEPYELKGKRISLTGFMKGHELYQGVDIELRYFYEDEEVVEVSRLFSGSFDWSPFSISFDAPALLESIGIYINMKGNGIAWIDNIELLIEGNLRKIVEVAEAFPKGDQTWFYENSTPFTSPYPSQKNSQQDVKELRFFEHTVDNSRIVALGESTHGTHEFFTLKHKLLQYAVEEMGFRVFAIEDHQVIVENVNEYVKTGTGTAEQSMRGMFGVWNRQEVLDLIRWIRKYNIEHPKDMVSFIGFDIQDFTPSANSLEAFLQTQDTMLLTELKPMLHRLKEHASAIFTVRDTVVKQQWVEEAISVFNKVKNKQRTWMSGAASIEEQRDIYYGIQYAKLLVQFFQEGLHNGQMLYRDQAMAENLSWYLNYINPESRIIVWAHDVHISRGEAPGPLENLHSGKSMGAFLAKQYGAAYKAFGLSTYTGTYRAFKTYSYQELIACPLLESPIGTIEEVLHQISRARNTPYLFLRTNNAPAWLHKPLPVRFANHVSFDYSFWPRIVVPAQFDGLFFIDETSSARLLGRR